MGNIILTNLSSLKNPGDEYTYASDIGDITGIQTNDAPVKYLLSLISSKNQNTEKIIAVATSEADEAYEAFCKMVEEYAESEKISLPQLEKIHTSDSTIAETIQEIVNRISPDDRVYIDTTGGFRKSSYLLMGVVRVLEYSENKVEKAVYSKYVRGNVAENAIEDVTELYRMFDLINAVNTFATVGNSYELENYFKDCQNAVVRKTIDAMNEFSDEITLCRTSKLNDVIQKLNECLAELSQVKSDSKDIILFKSLSDVIRSKFNVHNGSIEYPAVVKWCLDNKLIQQAVTVYVEKMPEYFYEKGYYNVSEKLIEETKRRNEKSHFGFCYDLFYGTFMQDSGLPEDITLLKDMINSANIDGEGYKRTDSDILLSALNESPDISVCMNRLAIKSLKKYNFESMRKYFQSFIRVRNAFYADGRLRDEAARNDRLKDYPEIIEMVSKSRNLIPNSPMKFPLVVFKNPRFIASLFGVERKFSDNHISFIENIESKAKGKNHIFTDKLEISELQQIFRDIYYAKNFVRNKLNHASEDETDNEEMKNYFKKYGYKTDDELNVSDISEFMYNAIEKLKL